MHTYAPENTQLVLEYSDLDFLFPEAEALETSVLSPQLTGLIINYLMAVNYACASRSKQIENKKNPCK